MLNPRVKKPAKTLGARIKALRQRPTKQEDIDRLNKVFDEIEKNKQSEEPSNQSEKKLLDPPRWKFKDGSSHRLFAAPELLEIIESESSA